MTNSVLQCLIKAINLLIDFETQLRQQEQMETLWRMGIV